MGLNTQHTLNLQRKLGAQSANTLPSRLRDKPSCQAEASVMRKLV